MFCVQRAALRALTRSSQTVLLASRPRTLAYFAQSPLRRPVPSTLLSLQKRWASEEVSKSEAEATDTPISPDVAESVAQADEAETSSAAVPEQQGIEESDAPTEVSPPLTAASNAAARVPDAAQGTSNVLYVGNLFFDVTAEDLEREFSKFGDVLQAKIIYDSRGLSKGFAYVTFGTVEHAAQAMENLNQQLFEGRRMAVQFRKERQNTQRAANLVKPKFPSKPSRTLFIGNMSFEMTDQDLNDLFRDARNVIDVRVAIDRRSGQPRGFAHADFIDVASATKAKEMLGGKEVYGRRLRVDYSQSRRDGQEAGERGEQAA